MRGLRDRRKKMLIVLVNLFFTLEKIQNNRTKNEKSNHKLQTKIAVSMDVLNSGGKM